MIQDWIVHITPTTSGQKIFEKCDLQSYSEKRKEYDLLTKTEKSGLTENSSKVFPCTPPVF